MTQVGERVSNRLTNYLQAPQDVVATNHLAVKQGILSIKDFKQLRQQFWQQTTLNSSWVRNGIESRNSEVLSPFRGE
jgi:hypothetical protein